MNTDFKKRDNQVEWSIEQLRETDLDSIQAPERIVITFPVDSQCPPVDIGRIAYLDRHFDVIASNKKQWNIKEESLSTSRRRIILDIISNVVMSTDRPISIHVNLSNYLNIVDELDSTEVFDFAESVANALLAYQNYSAKLSNEIRTNAKKPITVSIYQRYLRNILEIIFPDEDLDKEIFNRVPTILRGRKEQREAPDREFVNYYAHMLAAIFQQISKQIINKKDFPFRFECDYYESYIIPIIKGTNHYISTPYNEGQEHPFFDFHSGICLDKNAIEEKISNPDYMKGRKKTEQRKVARKLLELIKLANNNPNSKARLSFASLAQKAYFPLFIHATGMNLTPALNLKFDGQYEIQKAQESKDFRVIKFRSGGRELTFKIGRIATQLFKQYIALRKWLLAGKECEYLFFSNITSNGQRKNPTRMQSATIDEFLNRLIGKWIPKDYQKINASGLRTFKANVMAQMGEDITTTSKALQHANVSTTAEQYSGGNKLEQQSQFSNLFGEFDNIINANQEDDERIASGSCKQMGKPIPIAEEAPIQPSCNLPQGCLFCEHYTLHSDEEDLYKIMSLKYFLETIIEEFPDLEHANELYSDILGRIDEIILFMKQLGEEVAATVEQVRKKVFDAHIIHQFWDIRLQRLDRLGVVAI